jgi:hypothetical protein
MDGLAGRADEIDEMDEIAGRREVDSTVSGSFRAPPTEPATVQRGREC